MREPPELFESLPLEAQIQRLSQELTQAPPEDLLSLCAGLRDPAPLVWLCVELFEKGLLAPKLEHFAHFLLTIPDTSIDKVVKGLSASKGEKSTLEAVLLSAMKQAPLTRLPAFCLLDRTLKQHFPEAWEHHLAAQEAKASSLLQGGQPIPPELFAHLSARSIERLRTQAPKPEEFDKWHEAAASQAILVLRDQPKGVSQANAEELLSRRVYTDPGHFLIELLQNAEDARAHHWRVRFEKDRIIVWHDGLPFDMRDLVGVTSIGQTTKRKQQIGFFGVGFKSVYEVTERPQLYSGVYEIEIVDVSVPKQLSGRPASLPQDGTVLVLPLRSPSDPERNAEALYQRAIALDPCVLFTLQNIERLTFEHPDSGRFQDLRESHSPRGAFLKQQPVGWTKEYLLQEAEHQYSGARMAGRPDRTRVMVGVSAQGGVPRPLEEGVATAYSYLPTAEQTGLRFFIQGHFDVPVDRERITAESSWNEWIVEKVPALLGKIAQEICDRPLSTAKLLAARGFCEILPLPGEMKSELFSAIPPRLSVALKDTAILPGADRALHAPQKTWVTEPALASLFRELPFGDRFLLEPSLPSRTREVALLLGAKSLDADGLLSWVELALQDETFFPGWVKFLEEKRERLFDFLLGELERREREDDREGFERWLERLQRLPLLPSTDGKLYAANLPNGVARGLPVVRALFLGARPMLDERLDASCAQMGRPKPASRTTLFLDRVGVPTLEIEDVLRLLEQQANGRDEVEGPQSLPFLGTEERRLKVVELLASANSVMQARGAKLPLYAGTSGHLHRAARDLNDTDGLIWVRPGRVGEKLRVYYGQARLILSPSASPAEMFLLERLRVPTLDLETLAYDLHRAYSQGITPFRRTEDLFYLHTLLEDLREEIPSRLKMIFAQLPLWLDQQNIGRPLLGEHAVFVARSKEISSLFEAVPFLHEQLLERSHLQDFGARSIGIDEVISAFSKEAAAPLILEPTPARVSRVLSLLLQDGASLSQRSRLLLWRLPLMLSDEGAVCSAVELRLATAPALRDLFKGIFHFLDPLGESAAVLRALELFEHIKRCDAEELLTVLTSLSPQLLYRQPEASLPFLTSQEKLDSLLSFLGENAGQLNRGQLLRYAKLALFPDSFGRLAFLGDFRKELDREHCYPCEPAVRPLWAAAGLRSLHPDAQTKLSPFLEALALPSAGAEAAIELMKRRLQRVTPPQPAPPLQSPENLALLQQLLLTHKEELSELHPISTRQGLPPASALLCRLPLWRTRRGAVVCADELIDPKELASLFAPGTAEQEELYEATVDEESAERLRALAPLVVPAPKEKFLARLVERLAKDKAPLSAQPSFLSSIEKVLALYDALRIEEPQAAPLVDATGRLRMSGLYRADEETCALLQGTPACGDLVHPAFLSKELESKLSLLPFSLVLQAFHDDTATLENHPFLQEESRRFAFYQWLNHHEPQLFSDPLSRELLALGRFFPSERGALLRASELHFDAQLPSLEIDCRPHPEIPQETRELLRRHLGAGRLSFEDLLRLHVVPAYQSAVEARLHDRARGLLLYAAKQLQGMVPPPFLRELLFEDNLGRFFALSDLILPEASVSPAIQALWKGEYPIVSEKYPDEVRRLLVDLGVSTTPSEAKLLQALLSEHPTQEQSLALCEIIGRLSRSNPQLIEELPLRRTAWLLDGAGCVRRPEEIYLREPEIENLVGDFSELFASPEVISRLGEAFCQKLGFRRLRDVTLEEVVRQIDAKQANRAPLSFRVYQWMEQGVEQGWLDPVILLQTLQEKPWIYSDDGVYCYPEKVLGVWAFSYFGERRGYWERGRESCPRLCQLFSIQREVTPELVAAFLEEIGQEAAHLGDQTLLTRERALPRMLFSCYSLLGRAQVAFDLPRSLPFILCQLYPVNTEAPRYKLLRPDTLALYRSDTPTLESLFADAGTLFLTAQGPSEERDAIDRFYQSQGIRRLREAYQITVADGIGEETSEQNRENLVELRGILRSFLSVLPRIKKQRGLPNEHWVYESRLRPLAAVGAIRAFDQLRACYKLPGVGQSYGEVPALYDVSRGELFLDAHIFYDPEGALSGLALGLMPSFYQGPGEEQLIDLCEILLPLRSREKMNAYLDRRHFPAAEENNSLREHLAERLGEILDFGLAHRIEGLAPRDLNRWREPSLLSRLGDGTRDVLAARLVSLLLDVLALPANHEAGPTLFTLLTLPSLRQLPTGLLQLSPTPSYSGDRDTPPDGTPQIVQDASWLESLPAPSLSQLPLPSLPDFTPAAEEEWQPVDVPQQNIWQRFMRWVRGSSEGPPVHAQLPPWAAQGANTLQPSPVILPQLWATPQNRQRVMQNPSMAKIVYSPPRLPMPHLYAVYTLGVSFDPQTQSWSSNGAPLASIYAPGRSTGRIASFQGRLMAGTNQLPMPLYSRLHGPIVSVEGSRESMFAAQPDPTGAFQARLQTEQPQLVRFEVELLEPPTFTNEPLSLPGHQALLTPTLPLRKLPLRVQQWLQQEANAPHSPWTRALAVREFIKSHYRYQDDFLERPDVRRAIGSLRPGEGNHHLALLHASAEGEILGHGICYELNLLAVELLRHLQIPAMVATGWIFDLGELDRPDHMFALALLSTAEGVALLPIDASTDTQGPIRPLATPRPMTPNDPRRAPAFPEPVGPWGAPSLQSPRDWQQQLDQLQWAERQRQVNEALVLVATIQNICRIYQLATPANLSELARAAVEGASLEALSSLWELARQLLPQPELLSALVSIERGEFQQVTALTPAVQELVRRGLARVRTVPYFQVFSTRSEEPPN